MNIFRKFKAYLRLKEAVRKAEKAHEETGERYYVIPVDSSNKLIVMDRKNFRKLKFKGYLPSGLHVSNLERGCFYCTSYRNGKDSLPQNIVEMKRKQYYNWIESLKKTKHGKR